MIDNIYNRFQGFVTAFTGKKYWKLYLAIICSLYCIFSNLPQYKTMVTGKARNIAIWNRINRQIDHPFTPDFTNDPEAHESKLTFRLVPPMIGKLLPSSDLLHRIQWLYFVQNIFGLLFFYLLILFAEANFNNRFFSFMLPLCFAVLYAGKTFFVDMFMLFDGMAYLFLLISITARNPILIFVSLFLAYYTDERALIGSGFVMLFHVLKNNEGQNKPAIISIILAIAAYLSTRFYMQTQLGMMTPSDGLHLARIARDTPFSFFMLGIFSSFKSFWLFIIAGLFYLKKFWPRAIFIVTLLTLFTVCVSVFDFSRSFTYGFVGLLTMLYYFYQQKSEHEKLNRLVLVLFFTCLINPIYDVHGIEPFMTRSIIGRYFDYHFLMLPQ